MTDAFIYDHVRTPRGRGKADGALHEVTALNLATQALATLRERNRLDPSLVDDVVLGMRRSGRGSRRRHRPRRRASAPAMATACRGSRSTGSARRGSMP